MLRSRHLPFITGVLLLTLGASPVAAQVVLAPSAGVFGLRHAPETVGEVGLEVRLPVQLLWQIQPVLGGMLARGEATYVYTGFLRDFPVGKRWYLTPVLGVGFYNEGEGMHLGHDIEFRSAIELGYEITPGTRLALTFYHLSNASLAEKNPGSESLVFSWSAPLRRGRGSHRP